MPLQMIQFVNQMMLAMGNTYRPQAYSDATGTPTNPAKIVPISSITVDAFGVVTITTSVFHGIDITQGKGANVLLAGILNSIYNSNNGISAFITLDVPNVNTVVIYNPAAIGQAPSSGGTLTVTTVPLISTFTTAYPIWATGVTYLEGDIIVPTISNNHFYKCVQGGVSAATQPAFPTATGARVAEVSPSAVVWQEAGQSNTTAPAPPGASHLVVFSSALFAWDTFSSNTANGLDGPCCLRMSDVNNPNSWNPINQAFLDKDDGTEGMGIAAFTIAGFGIPPEGSLVAFKQFAGYQIVGVFGSPNFLIQRIKSNLGCTASRTISFTTGFGLTRFTHLGFAVYDGMNDRIISEEIRPYLFASNNIEVADITSLDYNSLNQSWGAQTAYPPMYVCAMPIGNSNGNLTRLFCYDLVLKAWVVVDLPFSISVIFQALTTTTAPVTIMGTVDDGALHRWQAGDNKWDNSIDAPGPSLVKWSGEMPLVQNQKSQGGRIYCRQIVVRGQLTDPAGTVAVAIEFQGEAAISLDSQQINYGTDGTYSLNTPINLKGTNLSPIISGTGAVEVSNVDVQIKPEIATVPGVLT